MAYNYDPELRDIVPMLPIGSFDDIPAARKNMNDMLSAFNKDLDTSGLTIEDRSIPGLAGDPDVPVRIYSNSGRSGTTGALLYIHGGGFAVGNLESEHGGAVMFARELGVPLVSVGYRLAPEHPFPAAMNDCYAALQWLHDNAESLAVDRNRIGICGQSAGGGLAASTVLKAKAEGGPAIHHQFLGIPELDDRLITPSMRQFTDTPMWNRPNAEFSWQYYLGDQYQPGAADVPVLAAPARASANELTDLPPAFITAMEFDPLRDEAIHYALKLMEAGVSVELHVYPGTFHGSSMVQDAAVSRRQNEHMLGALQRALASK